MLKAGIGYLDKRFYPQFGDVWDADLFRHRVEAHLTVDSRLLDVGAGRGALTALDFRSPGRRISAVDVDDAVLTNPYADEAKLLGAGGEIPYDENQFDIVIAHNVLEHLPDPLKTFREIHRVLRSGGVFLAKTPNRRHYVPAIARMTPHGFHVWINRLRGRDEHDTFPTVYRCNTPDQLASVARQAGFSVESIELVEGRPEYLRLNVPMYLAGLLYERAVNGVAALRGFRGVIFSTLRKP